MSLPAKDRDWRLLFAALLIYAVAFGALYPPLAGVEDESGFINQAFAWSRGSLSAEGAGFERLPDFIPARNGEHVSWRNPGRSLTLLPLLASGQDHLAFATGALVHVATVLVAALVLATAGASPLWAILVLCHPTLALFSRTVLADGLGGLFLLGAVAAALAAKNRAWLVGVMLGLAVVTRYQAAIVVPFVLLVLWRERGWRAALAASVTVGAIGLGLAGYNLTLFGRVAGAIGNTVDGETPVLFSLGNVPTHLPFFAMALTLLWPLQWLALASDVGPVRRYACAIGLPVLGLLLCFFYRDTGGGFVQELVVGQRLLQIALPVWIVCYALAARKLFLSATARWPRLAPAGSTGVVAFASAILLAGQVALFHRHQDHLLRLAHAKQQIVQHVPPGSTVRANQVLHKLFWTYPDCARLRWREIGGAREVTCATTAAAGDEYVAFLGKGVGEIPAGVRALIAASGVTRVPTDGELLLYRIGP